MKTEHSNSCTIEISENGFFASESGQLPWGERLEIYFAIIFNAFFFFFDTAVCFMPVHHGEKEKKETRLKLLIVAK